MTRFSVKPEGQARTTNYEGEVAYKLDPHLELYSLVCTSVFNSKYYTSNKSELERLRELLPHCDSDFIHRLAIYAREQMHLRTIPLVLLVELLKLRNYIPHRVVTRVIQRPDEIYELLGYYSMANDRAGAKKLNKLSNQLKKGIANAFYKFDEYQFAKYNRSVSPSLKDALFLTHPIPKRGFKLLFRKIADDKLSTPLTWETETSEKGSTKEVWDGLVKSKKMGYMATLRNLRNMLNVDADMGPALSYIANKEAVAKSKQLPFRFFSAYQQVRENASFGANATLKAIEQAAKYSAMNIPFQKDKILIAADSSGSMAHPISDRSSLWLCDIGILFGKMVQYRSPKSIFGLFSDYWTPITSPYAGDILESTISARKDCSYGCTNGHLVLDWMIRQGVEADKLFFFTDGQMWNSDEWGRGCYGHNRSAFEKMWNAYKQIVPHAKMYLFDLAGYGVAPVRIQGDVYMISGWSDKVFGVLEKIDSGQKALSIIEDIDY